MNIGFTKTFHAGGAVIKRRFVKFDGSGDVVQASASADLLIGVSDTAGDVASGDRIDVLMSIQPEIEAGAAIAAGAPVTSNADGKAVTAAAGQIAGGFAVESADADGDIITIHICRHKA